MDLPPLRAAALAATAILAIPCGVAQAQGTDVAAPAAAETAPAPIAAGDGGTVDAGTQTLAGGDSSGEASQEAPAQEAAPLPSEPAATPPVEQPPTSATPPPEPTPQTTASPPSGDPTRASADSTALPQSRDSAPDDAGESATTSAATPAAPAPPQDPTAGAPNPPDVRPDATEVDRLLPALKGKAARPVDEHRPTVQLPQDREPPPSHARVVHLDPYTWVHSPAHAPPRVVTTAEVERKRQTPPATGSGEDGGPDNHAPSSPAPGSASASPGGGFFAAGLASLAAILIGLVLPQLRARLELPPRGRCTVAFLRPLERPG